METETNTATPNTTSILSKMNKLYTDSKDCDKGIFAEQRTNILLKNGEHYRQKQVSGLDQVRGRINVPRGEVKIRLVKNHIHKICNIYENAILESNPSVTAMPYNDSELHDVKSAELNNAVLAWVKETIDYDELQEDFVGDFTTEGEMYAKIRFDYDKGKTIARTDLGEDIKEGQFNVTRIMPYDLKRDPDSVTMRDSRFLIEDSLMNVSDFVDLAQKIRPESVIDIQKHYKDPELTVFDSSTARYKKTRGKVNVRLWYWRPTKSKPNGLFQVSTDKVYVGETELPLGLFPIVSGGFDKLTNSPRSTAIIRVIKPFQVEYNRCNSKMAEHQITLGDDRVYIQKGTKLTGGKVKSGVRSYQVSGQPPVIQSGRSGAQYLDYAKDTKADMYDAANIDYATLNKQPAGDSYQMLFASMKDKKKFVKYVNKYARFEVKMFKLILKMAKTYLSEEHIIKIAGKKEAVNVPEFKSMEDSGYEIKVEASSGDIESKFGKVLSLTHVLQYAGSSLAPEAIGQIIRSMPYGNESVALDTLTMKSKNAENLILALDRGEWVDTMVHDDHEFILKALYNRIKSSDFNTLDEEVQGNYYKKIGEQEAYFEKQRLGIQQANMGMIPSGGTLTTVNTSWFNPERKRVERIKLPTQAIQWLLEKLQQQGTFAESLEGQDPQVAANLGESQPPQVGQEQGQPQGQPEIAPQVQGV